MEDLIQKVKRECAEGYFAAPYYKIEPFGATSEESAVIFRACFPSQNHFSKFWVRLNPSIPEPLQKLVEDCDNGLRRKVIVDQDGKCTVECHRNQLYVFQYPLNMRMIASYVEDCFTKPGFEIDHPELAKATTSDFLEKFRQRFNGGSCVYMTFTGAEDENTRHVPLNERGKRRDLNIPLIVGKKEIMQEIMDFLKQQPQNIFDFFQAATVEKERWVLPYLQDNTKNIHMYDVRGRPKEVHFILK